MKRFYNAVEVTRELGIALDGKPVRTPARAPFALPTAALAAAVAAEWDAQVEHVRPATMPLTGLSNAAIDRITPDTATFAASLAAYAKSELLCYRAERPASLLARQEVVWDPLLAWATARYDVAFTLTAGILPVDQPSATLARLGSAFVSFDAFRLAALNQAVTITGSAVVALALAEGRIDADAAWAAGQLDELWQAEQWGADPLAAAAQAERQAGLAAAARLLALL